MNVAVTGMGAWGPGFSTIDELRALLEGAALPEDATTARPAPASIPPRERRRAPLSVKLAVAVAEQACEAAGVAPAEPVSVFASGMGDMDITDYMCRTLASDTPLISPTRFHNSVHNAPVGYWSISQGARRSSNAVAGFRHTVPASLLEAVTQCVTEGETVLWASQDIASPAPFRDIADIPEACAFALVLEPSASQAPSLTFEVATGSGAWPPLESAPLASLYAHNPTARVLPLVALLVAPLAGTGAGRITLPLNDHLDLVVERS
ncbi:MAG: beta-ketoacyl synthase chain length factor [Xanthomonadales bacterium]|jgi:hypothetical protein|nr:beta-ketoacyl synthase chain length factor [Xanthomonadales bacterium]